MNLDKVTKQNGIEQPIIIIIINKIKFKMKIDRSRKQSPEEEV